jgi:hypothetical protein
VQEREERAEDLSGAEYLSRDDREKTVGYNGVPHRPPRPAREKQLRDARSGERRRSTEDAG